MCFSKGKKKTEIFREIEADLFEGKIRRWTGSENRNEYFVQNK